MCLNKEEEQLRDDLLLDLTMDSGKRVPLKVEIKEEPQKPVLIKKSNDKKDSL